MGIQIHELTALNRAPQTGDVLAVDTGTTTNKVDYSALRGAVLTDAVRTDDDQNLTDPQKAQAIENIGAATQADVTAIEDEIGDTTLPTTAQTITGAIAEHETDISDVKTTLSGTVKFNVDQSIGSANKARARNNIGAASSDAVETIQNTVNHCVKFSSQTLTDSQKAQARTNIGAASEADTDALETLVGNTTLPTTAQTVTGAIAEHETDISNINSAIGTVPSGSNLQGEVDDLKSAVNDPATGLDTKATAIIDIASGSIASFPDGADGLPVKSLTVGIEPVQSGSGDPSPTNVRPITGWTGANVTRTGKNLLDESHFLECYGWTLTDGVYSGSNIYLHTNFNNGFPGIAFKENTQYTFSATFKSAEDKITVFGFRYTDGTSTDIYPQNTSDVVISITSTVGKTVNRFVISYGGSTTVYISGAMLAEGSAGSNFVPYQGQTIPITFPSEAGTIYGGTLDVTTGLLTVTMAEVDLGTLNWSYVSGANARFVAELSDLKLLTVNMVCSCFVVDTVANIYLHAHDNAIGSHNQYNNLWVYASEYTDSTAFKTAVSGQQLVYELATPQTYQLTPTEVTLLLGDNNVWADTGDSIVTYRADTKLYIQKINAPTDDDMTADAQIASGKYFIVGGNLYRSTTTIPAGDTINPGTNCILTNLADALNALNA